MASGRTARGAIAFIAALVIGGGLGFGLHVADEKRLIPVKIGPERVAPSAAAAPLASASSAAPLASESASPAEPPRAPPPATSASANAPAADASPGACLRVLFPDDTFTSEPHLPFVCEENAAASAVTQLKTQIVVEGRGRPATGGMKEWAVLGFYEVAALALARGRCCPSAPPLTVADADASKPGAHADELDAAVKQFDGEVRCLMKIQQTKRFGYEPLLGGEASTFAKMTARLPR